MTCFTSAWKIRTTLAVSVTVLYSDEMNHRLRYMLPDLWLQLPHDTLIVLFTLFNVTFMSAATNASKNCWRCHRRVRNNKQRCEIMCVKFIVLVTSSFDHFQGKLFCVTNRYEIEGQTYLNDLGIDGRQILKLLNKTVKLRFQGRAFVIIKRNWGFINL
jgi:hypothetical protein